MDYLWSPLRYRYIIVSHSKPECVFCEIAASREDRANFVLHRARHNFVLLNLYPYASGHVMVAPYQHAATLSEAPEETAGEMMSLMRRAEACSRET